VLSSKPARIVAEIGVPLARPRNPLSHEFTRIRATCVEIMHSLGVRTPRNATAPEVTS